MLGGGSGVPSSRCSRAAAACLVVIAVIVAAAVVVVVVVVVVVKEVLSCCCCCCCPGEAEVVDVVVSVRHADEAGRYVVGAVLLSPVHRVEVDPYAVCCTVVSIAARLDMACWMWDVLVQV